MKKIVALALLGSTAALTKANPSPIGVDVYAGAFYPVSDKVRDALGGVWFLYGITPSETPSQEGDWKILPGLSFLYKANSTNHVFLVRPQANLVRYFGDGHTKLRPYVSISAGPVYYNYGITVNGTRFSRQRWGIGGGVSGGVLINERLRIGLQFDAWSKFDGLDFNGLTLEASYRLF